MGFEPMEMLPPPVHGITLPTPNWDDPRSLIAEIEAHRWTPPSWLLAGWASQVAGGDLADQIRCSCLSAGEDRQGGRNPRCSVHDGCGSR
jgi:hypothetical protein